jgi:hypothetical protein
MVSGVPWVARPHPRCWHRLPGNTCSPGGHSLPPHVLRVNLPVSTGKVENGQGEMHKSLDLFSS